MGTRGLFGFRRGGLLYLVYNHWDSYFSGLGVQLLEALCVLLEEAKSRGISLSELLLERFQSLKIVDTQAAPTPEDVSALSAFTDLSVSQRSTSDWYCLTRLCQGNLCAVLDSRYLLLHTRGSCVDVPWDIWIEYAYVVDLDRKRFEASANGDEEPIVFPLDDAEALQRQKLLWRNVR